MLKNKIKGGALQFVLFIGAVIVVLLLAFISLAYSHHFFQKKGDLVLEAVALSNDGINYLLHNNIKVNDSVYLEIEIGNEDQSVTAYKSYWGIFEKLLVHSKLPHSDYTKVALAGGRFDRRDSYSLFLQENNRPLVLVGNSKLQGRLLLPKDGVRPGNMGGKSFTGTVSPPSDILVSKKKLPVINRSITDHIKMWLEGRFEPQMELTTINYPLRIKNSFKNNTKLIYSDSSLQLERAELVGNIIVYSSSSIRIGRETIAKDVIFIAPVIEIEQGFIGTLQAIASKRVIVAENVRLNYPSAIAVFNPKMINPQANILIGEHSRVKGAVAYWEEERTAEQSYNAQIKIDNTAVVEGEVYCSNAVELLGEVRGSITTSYFTVNKFGSVYQNHIYGGRLNVNLLHDNYTGMLYDTDQNKKIVKWLY